MDDKQIDSVVEQTLKGLAEKFSISVSELRKSPDIASSMDDFYDNLKDNRTGSLLMLGKISGTLMSMSDKEGLSGMEQAAVTAGALIVLEFTNMIIAE